MKHVLHHVGDRTTGTVDLYIDVGMKDFEVDADQRDFIKAALIAKLSVGILQREFGGVTLIAYSSAATPADQLSLISTIIATLVPPQTVQVTAGGASWDKY